VILHGDVREQLRTLPAASVQCVVTSPPYWALRDYKLPPLVWGGNPACAHEWGEEATAERYDHLWATSTPPERRPAPSYEELSLGAFCRHCGAWRGSLGLEPTPELYVAHMVDVFREVRRVLRDDGTLWMNLGDTYVAAPRRADRPATRLKYDGRRGTPPAVAPPRG